LTEQARLEQTPSGRVPATDGWFTVNVGDAAWRVHDTFGASCRFESPEAGFGDLGINLRVLMPGQPNGRYHSESEQEDFLVLTGECLLLIEGEERRLRAWDFVHCPPDTDHIFIGAGDGPSVILMTGSRSADATLNYPVSELALRYDAGVERQTTSAAEAYASFSLPEPRRPETWDGLPWSS
jgi:uncharacterized cupin superfamily protein